MIVYCKQSYVCRLETFLASLEHEVIVWPSTFFQRKVDGDIKVNS